MSPNVKTVSGNRSYLMLMLVRIYGGVAVEVI